MAIVTDPDDLRRSTNASGAAPTGELFIDPTVSPPIIEIISTDDDTGGTVSNIDPADGVLGQALYSKLKELWKTEADLIKYPFPMEAITAEQYEFINNWELDDSTTASRTYVRTAGWTEKDAAGVVKQEWMSVITLGSFVEEATQTAYFFWAGDTTKTDFTYPGPVNEAVKIYGDATHGNFDNRSTVLTVAIRPAPTGSSGSVVGYTFNQSTTTDIGAPTVTYQAYRFPLTSVVDLNLDLTDAEIASLETSRGFQITWYAVAQQSNTFLPFDLVGGPHPFHVIINATNGSATTSEIYNWVQWSLRQAGDIDDGAGTEYGFSTPALVEFVGPTLQTFDIDVSATEGGVALDGFDTNFANDISMREDDGTLHSFPYVAAGSLVFNTNLIEDAASKYWMFNSTGYGTAGATLIQDNSDSDITGDVHYQAYSPATGNASGTTGSATQGSAVFTVSGETWTVDDLIGQVLVVAEGDATVDGYYWIIDNDATTITVDRPFEGTLTNIDWSIRAKNTTGVIGWDYDYTTDGAVNVTIVAIGLETAQYVVATASIAEATGQNFSVTSALERNYNDPT